MTQIQAPETTHGAVRAAINNNATDAETRLFNETINVKQASDFGTIDSTKLYVVDGIIDMSGVEIEVPAGGLNLCGHNFNVSQLINSALGETLFVSPIGGSGDILIDDLAIEMSGAGSQVFDLVADTADEAAEFTRVNWNNCASLGTIDNYRQGLETGTGRFGGKPSLTLKGIWAGGYFIETSIVRDLDNTMATALYVAGAGFTMASRFRSNQNADLGTLAPFVDFTPSNFLNPSTLQLQGCLIVRNGVQDATDTTIIPNIAAGDVASNWFRNVGINNTFVGGKNTVSVAAATVITVQGQFEDLAGTFVATELEHFDSPVNGRLRHLGDTPRQFRLSADLTVEGPANDDIAVRVRIFDSSLPGFVDLPAQSRQINALSGGRNVAFFGLFANITLDEDDYAILQVTNNSGTANLTAEADSFFIIDPR